MALSLKMLDEVGLTPTGVTSPWTTGNEVEEDYAAAISRAFYEVFGSKDAWYFLHHSDPNDPNAHPAVTKYEDGRRIVSIFATFSDDFWQCINTPDKSEAFIRSVADFYISEDGTKGELIRQLNGGSIWPVMITHWQSLYSNGLYTGLRALDLVGQRIQKHLSDRVEWVDFTQLMNLSLAES